MPNLFGEKLFVIIAGAGTLGYYLAELLFEEEHEVLVIDKDKAACDKIKRELGINVRQGDATETGVLQEAGVKECNAFVALTSSDETNMVICLLAKELGAKTVSARLEKVEYDEAVLKRLGIDIVIHPKAAAAGYIAELITKPNVLDLAFISRGAAEIMEINVTEKSKVAGKKAGEISHPEGSAIVALVEGTELIIPNENTVIKPGDKLLVLAKREMADNVRKLIS